MPFRGEQIHPLILRTAPEQDKRVRSRQSGDVIPVGRSRRNQTSATSAGSLWLLRSARKVSPAYAGGSSATYTPLPARPTVRPRSRVSSKARWMVDTLTE
ncbi:hypothetical protein GCM10012279_24700 [Micromonospora yangpuensis]|nr:hypothetical protein GCM10012279_24700 [Micromonospora yangpuensis]